MSVLLVSVHSSTIDLSVSPSSGLSPENIVLRCALSPASSSTLAKLENVYLRVRTDDVKPGGILLMFDDGRDKCEINSAKPMEIDFCNATLIVVRMSHTLLNQTLEKIDYSCSRGTAQAMRSFHITSERFFTLPTEMINRELCLEDRSARYFDPIDNQAVKHTSTLLVFVSLLRIFIKDIWASLIRISSYVCVCVCVDHSVIKIIDLLFCALESSHHRAHTAIFFVPTRFLSLSLSLSLSLWRKNTGKSDIGRLFIPESRGHREKLPRFSSNC